MERQYEIGNLITELRKEKKLTQSKLAEALGVTDKSVSKWENGKSLPDTKIMPRLCEILGISLEELLNGKLNPITESPVLDDLSRHVFMWCDQIAGTHRRPRCRFALDMSSVRWNGDGWSCRRAFPCFRT